MPRVLQMVSDLLGDSETLKHKPKLAGEVELPPWCRFQGFRKKPRERAIDLSGAPS